MYPYLASAHSLVEMFCEPLGEIHKKFRTSELVLLAWQSRERSAQMERRMHKGQKKDELTSMPEALIGVKTEDVLDEHGIPHINKMTGQQQLAFLASRGVHVPLIPPAIGKVQ